MCNRGRTIKLCTCDTDEIDPDAMWTLYRAGVPYHGHYMPRQTLYSVSPVFIFIPFALIVVVIDLIFFLKAKRFQSLRSKMIMEDLNNFDVFDFSYTPQNRDVLHVKYKKEEYFFEYDMVSLFSTRRSVPSVSKDKWKASSKAVLSRILNPPPITATPAKTIARGCAEPVST